MGREVVSNVSNINERKRRIFKNKKIILVLFFIVLLLGSSVTAYWAVSKNLLIKEYANKVYPSVYVMGKDVSGLSKEELKGSLDEMLNSILEESFKVTVGDKIYTGSKEEFAVSLDTEAIVEEVISYGKNKSFLKKINLLEGNKVKRFDYNLTYNSELVNEFVNKIEEETFKVPVDATIDISPEGVINVGASQVGTKLNREDLINKISEFVGKYGSDEVTSIAASIEEVQPEVTESALKSVNKKISTFTTYFNAGPSAHNIAIGSGFIDNTLLMPGEEFSCVEAIGETTPDKGYVLANTYVDGKVVQGYGGGVCQIATTLYNAELRAGIKPTERLNHMMTVGYVGLGLDATIGDYAPDLKFVNPYDYPVVINAYTTGGSIVVEMWSEANVTEGITYEPKAYPSGGLYADTYLYGYDANGNCVSEEYLNSSSYMPFS